MRRFNTRSLRLLSLLFAVAVCGCVSRGTYDEVQNERDQLRQQRAQLEKQLAKLEASNKSLNSERLGLIDELEDLRLERGELKRDVQQLEKAKTALSADLSAREAALASREKEIERLHGTYEGLVSDLESEVAAGQIEIENLREGLRLNLAQEILFPSGSASLNPQGIAVLLKVADRLKSLPNRVEVQGHTDNVPLRGSVRFPSNWELAAARATEVVRLFASAGVRGERLTAVSFGEYAPVASNATPEGRAKNRRIEIRLKPEEEPAAAAVGSTAAP